MKKDILTIPCTLNDLINYADRFEEGIRQLADWLKEKKLKYAENVIDGLENTPKAFIGLFAGENLGKQIVKVSWRTIKEKYDETNYKPNKKGFIMKTKNALLTAVLTIALALPMFGQNTHDDKTKSEMKKHEMGKPTVDTTVDGLHMKIWLMTQKHHKKMMKEMKHNGMEMKDTSMAMNEDKKEMKHDMDKATKEAMMAGTHHMMLVLTDAASGKEIANASAKVLIVSPSKKNSSVDLMPMMNHFGDGLTLDEEGEYQFTVSVNVDGVFKTAQFQYEVED